MNYGDDDDDEFMIDEEEYVSKEDSADSEEELIDSEEESTSVFGIENGRIYCYMIATLQMLFTIKEFREYIIDYNFFLKKVRKA